MSSSRRDLSKSSSSRLNPRSLVSSLSSSISAPPELIQAIKRAAKRKKMSQNAFVEEAVKNWFRHRD